MLDWHGLDINDSMEIHILRSLPRRAVSALGLVCIKCAGMQRIGPRMDIRVEPGEAWERAEAELLLACKIGQFYRCG